LITKRGSILSIANAGDAPGRGRQRGQLRGRLGARRMPSASEINGTLFTRGGRSRTTLWL
jgi:hypothetical protein